MSNYSSHNDINTFYKYKCYLSYCCGTWPERTCAPWYQLLTLIQTTGKQMDQLQQKWSRWVTKVYKTPKFLQGKDVRVWSVWESIQRAPGPVAHSAPWFKGLKQLRAGEKLQVGRALIPTAKWCDFHTGYLKNSQQTILSTTYFYIKIVTMYSQLS